MKTIKCAFFIGLLFSLFCNVHLKAQSVYLFLEPFDYTGVDKKVVEEILYLFETQFGESSLISFVHEEQESDFMEQEEFLLDGSIRIRPIQIKNMFFRYKLVRGRVDLFPEHYFLFAEMVDMHTGTVEATYQFKGSLNELFTAGVGNMVLSFSSRLAKFGL